MQRIDTNLAENFLALQESLESILKEYGLSARFIAKQTDIAPSTFHRKMKDCNFTAREMIKICKAINK